jgi:hypothetical protein
MCSLASSDVFHRHEVCSSDKAGSPSGIPRHIFSLLGPHRMMLCRLPSRFVPSSCQGSSYSTAAIRCCCVGCPHVVFHLTVEAAHTAQLPSSHTHNRSIFTRLTLKWRGQRMTFYKMRVLSRSYSFDTEVRSATDSKNSAMSFCCSMWFVFLQRVSGSD